MVDQNNNTSQNTNTSQNNKRIAKNTFILYVRLLFMMAVSLFTSRVVLNALGVEDFGIYSVVGGVVAMLNVLTGSLSAAISRFITFELGKRNFEHLKVVFSTAVSVQLILASLIFVVAEIIGVWFLNTKMNIPYDRLYAGNWVLQFSILTFIINLISIPYNASIIAHEKMTAFAYISIVEVLLKLMIVYMLCMSPFDKLIAYSCLLCIVAIIVRIIYGVYCKSHFEECRWHLIIDKPLLKQMLSFSGWNFIGASSAVLRDQGVNIAINLFCGPAVNASRGIAMQVNSAVNGFVLNFMMALNPQITKNYAIGNYSYMFTLIFQGARLSFYILFLLSLPVIINAPYLLKLWLGIVPDYTIIFVRLVLIFTMCESISKPLITVMLATGKIRNYQIVVGGLQMLNFPISYYLLKWGFTAEVTLITAICISFLCLLSRLYMLKGMINLSIKDFFYNVFMNILIVSILSSVIPYLVEKNLKSSFISFVGVSLLCFINSLIIMYFVGCSKKERSMINIKVMNTLNKIGFKKK